MRLLKTILIVAFVSACTSSSVTPVSKNQFILNTSAAPVCGQSGAAKVAAKMAAVETLRAGYDGFIIAGARSSDNVRVVNTAPTGASTTSTYTGSGNSIYGTSNTTYTGGGPLVFGDYNRDLAVRMFKSGEPGYSNAVNAREFLGEGWQDAVKSGVSTCS